MAKKPRYDKEFKLEIVKLVTELGKKVSEVAREVQIPENTIRRWMKELNQSGKDAFPGEGSLKPVDAEIKELKKKLSNLEKENAILKKAVAIFTKDEK